MYKRGRQINGFTFMMRNRSTGAAITTGTVTGAIIKDGGTSFALSGTISHIAGGRWKINTISADEMDANLVHLLFTHTDGDRDFLINTVLFDPLDTQRLGLSCLPAALPDTFGGFFIIDGVNDPADGVAGATPAEIWDHLTDAMITPGSIGFKLASWNPGFPQSGDAFVRLGAPNAGSIAEDLAAIKADTGTAGSSIASILARLPESLVNGRIDANVGSIDGNQVAAQALARGALGLVRGTVAGGSNTAIIQTSSLDPAVVVLNQFKDRFICFDRNTTTAALRGFGTLVSAVSLGGAITVFPILPATPVNGDTFTIN